MDPTDSVPSYWYLWQQLIFATARVKLYDFPNGFNGFEIRKGRDGWGVKRVTIGERMCLSLPRSFDKRMLYLFDNSLLGSVLGTAHSIRAAARFLIFAHGLSTRRDGREAGSTPFLSDVADVWWEIRGAMTMDSPLRAVRCTAADPSRTFVAVCRRLAKQDSPTLLYWRLAGHWLSKSDSRS